MPLGIDLAKESGRQSLAASHPVEQARSADLRSHARSEVCHQQSESEDREHGLPGATCDKGERGVAVRKRLRSWPNQLRSIYLEGAKNSDDKASHHRGQK